MSEVDGTYHGYAKRGPDGLFYPHPTREGADAYVLATEVGGTVQPGTWKFPTGEAAEVLIPTSSGITVQDTEKAQPQCLVEGQPGVRVRTTVFGTPDLGDKWRFFESAAKPLPPGVTVTRYGGPLSLSGDVAWERHRAREVVRLTRAGFANRVERATVTRFCLGDVRIGDRMPALVATGRSLALWAHREWLETEFVRFVGPGESWARPDELQVLTFALGGEDPTQGTGELFAYCLRSDGRGVLAFPDEESFDANVNWWAEERPA